MDGSGNVVVRRGLRAPRAVVLFDAGDRWTFWARLAIHACSRVWGGAGFVLIPHRDGVVEPRFLEVARSVDPDYVLALRVPIKLFDQAFPGYPEIIADGKPLEGEARAEALAELAARDDACALSKDLVARDAVAAACTPYRLRRTEHGPRRERVEYLLVKGPVEPLTAISGYPGQQASFCLSAPADWSGLLGVAVAAVSGAKDLPELSSKEPKLEASQQWKLTRWLLDPADAFNRPIDALMHKAPGAVGSFKPETLPTAFALAGPGLRWTWRIDGPMRPGLISFGDAPEDFAVAYAYQRLYGDAVWLPAETWRRADENAEAAYSVFSPLRTHLSRLWSVGRRLTIASSSMNPVELEALKAAVSRPVVYREGEAEAETADRAAEIDIGEGRWGWEGSGQWSVEGQYAEDFNAPITRSADAMVMDASCPPAFVEDPDLASWSGLRWHVDLAFEGEWFPGGRGLDGGCLWANPQQRHHTWLRSSRNGVTYESDRYDFKDQSAPASTWLARPRLRIPSLTGWIDQVARQAGRGTAWSPAGRRVEVLQRLWGDRRSLAEDIAGPLRSVFHLFRSQATKDAEQYAPQDGRVLTTGKGDAPSEAYLTFQGIHAHLEGFDETELRRRLDALLETTALRRGMILDCGTCGKEAFIPIDDLAQHNRCPRCGTTNQLTQPRWHPQGSEPYWYYDLHPIAREHLTQNGDVPLLLAHHLATKSRAYSDVSELEIRDESGKRLAEIDLIAHMDGQLTIAEAKRPDNLGANQKAKEGLAKLFSTAELLDADQIILATAAPTWSPRTISMLRAKATSFTRHNPGVIVRTISGLDSGVILDTTDLRPETV